MRLRLYFSIALVVTFLGLPVCSAIAGQVYVDPMTGRTASLPDDIKARSVTIGSAGPIVALSNCSTITEGICIDTDDHQLYRWDGDSVENISGAGTDEVVYQADCSGITNGFCTDTDNGYLYYWDGDSVVLLWSQDLSTAGNPSFASVHASGGNMAAANKQVTKSWADELPYVADITSVIHGGKHYICISSHTGPGDGTTEPGVGAAWETYWEVSGNGIYQVSITGAILAAIVEAYGTHTVALTDVIYITDAAGNSYKTTIDDLLGLLADGHIPSGITRDTELASIIVVQSNCATITSGVCLDSDDGLFYGWDGDSVEQIGGGGTDEIVYQADCSGVTNGICFDTDDGSFYYWDGDSVEQVTAGSGDITGVLGDDTGAVPFLYQTWTAFTGGDATPDVSAAQHFRTVDTTTITGFDHGAGAITDGRTLTVYCGAATVFDLTNSEITSANRSSDYTCAAGIVLTFVYNTDQWYTLNIPDAYQTLASNGLVVNDDGVPEAVSIAGAGLAVASNGDGQDGNPTITVTAAAASDINTGTDATKALTADALAGSNLGTFLVTIQLHAPSTDLTTGDGKMLWTVPAELNGMNLISVQGAVYTVSSSGTPTFQIHNLTDTQDMLSTLITIDESEYSSATAVTAPVINASYDDVATGDRLRIDCDVAGTGTTGGEVTLGFRLP